MSASPILHIIAGPNGAGKSSFYEAILRHRIDAEFVNADRLVHAAIGTHATTLEHARLGQELAEARRNELMAAGLSLVTETTFSHVSKVEMVRAAQDRAYQVMLYHVSVDSADLAVARVGERYANGGHPVPEDRIRGRFARNRNYIRDAMHIAQAGWVFDNSVLGEPPRRLIAFESGKIQNVVGQLPAWAREVYAADLAAWEPPPA